VAICDECYRRNCGQRQTAKESLEKWGHIIFSANSVIERPVGGGGGVWRPGV
jgi:hypothetical protein